MAISAASTVGAASAVAGTTTVAAAAGVATASAAAAATVSTTTTVVSYAEAGSKLQFIVIPKQQLAQHFLVNVPFLISLYDNWLLAIC